MHTYMYIYIYACVWVYRHLFNWAGPLQRVAGALFYVRQVSRHAAVIYVCIYIYLYTYTYIYIYTYIYTRV